MVEFLKSFATGLVIILVCIALIAGIGFLINYAGPWLVVAPMFIGMIWLVGACARNGRL